MTDLGKWDKKALKILYNQIDYISIHNYWTLSDDYNVIMGQRALEVEQKITIPAAMIKEVRTRYEMAKPIYLVMDEWAPYGRDVFVDCEKFKATDFYKDIPYLDVTSSYSKDTKTMVINVVTGIRIMLSVQRLSALPVILLGKPLQAS